MSIDPQSRRDEMADDEPEEIVVVADEGDWRSLGGRVRAYLELIRAPAVFTALADVMLGFFFAYRPNFFYESGFPWTPPWTLLAMLLGASALLYTAGMVLNDFFDAQVDARERRRRPIPSGRVGRGAAGWLGAVLLLGGVGLAWVASLYAGGLRSGLIGSGLTAAVLLYDGLLKKTALGPLAMGACRMLNVLLGMSAGSKEFAPVYEEFSAVHYVLAGGVGLYIVGVTLFARREAGRSNPAILAAATAIMAAGIGLIGWFPNWANAAGMTLFLSEPFSQWQQFLGLIGALILYRCLMAIIGGGQPAHVQRAVANCLRSLIVLDAFACYIAAGREPAIAIFCLLVPTLLLGRWLYST
jgi:4-hydroxybenzoate polyprenyltransferase